MRAGGRTSAAFKGPALLLVLAATTASAEENRWNVNVETAALLTVDQPATALNADAFQTGGLHLRAAVEWSLHERIGAELGYGVDLLFHNVNGAASGFQQVVAGARFRPWFNKAGGYLIPRPRQGQSVAPLKPLDFLSDAWVDAHVGVSIAASTRFLYDVGVGARVPVINPLQLGIFVRWQQLLGGDGDPSFKQVIVGVTGSIGFLPVHAEPDDDDDGVPNSKDKCPDTPRGVEVNAAGCPYPKEETGPSGEVPKCSDTDLDGVCDGEDECPETKPGTAVDKHGCPVGGAAAPGGEGGDQNPSPAQ